MPVTKRTSWLELETDIWKSRAQAKQRWLELTLAEPAKSPREAEHQRAWIKQALQAVKRGQHDVKSQLALIDVYSAHLSALEMTLMSAEEARAGVEDAGSKRG